MTKPREPNGIEPSRSEDDIQRDQLGPRGVPDAPDPAKMTPQRDQEDAEAGRSRPSRLTAARGWRGRAIRNRHSRSSHPRVRLASQA
ncbi:hypothetical protein ACVWW5_003603 [Bradyrhizobium sp. LM3.4]